MTKAPAIYCALDRPDLDGALALARAVDGVVDGFKVGLEFVTANGPDGVRRVVALGLPVFLDLKFHDIPNTVAGAIEAARALGVAMLTLHVAGGPAMLRAAVEAARAREPCPRLIGVTVLTSLDDADLAVLGIAEKVPAHVARLAGLAWDCGVDGIVCAPHEVALLRSRFASDFTLVVPGIRPSGSVPGDQKRTKGPAAAVAGGADVLVIGRPITQARDPRAAAQAIRRRDRGGACGLSHGGRGQDLRPDRPGGARRRGQGRRPLARLRVLPALAARAQPRTGRRPGPRGAARSNHGRRVRRPRRCAARPGSRTGTAGGRCSCTAPKARIACRQSRHAPAAP